MKEQTIRLVWDDLHLAQALGTAFCRAIVQDNRLPATHLARLQQSVCASVEGKRKETPCLAQILWKTRCKTLVQGINRGCKNMALGATDCGAIDSWDPLLEPYGDGQTDSRGELPSAAMHAAGQRDRS